MNSEDTTPPTGGLRIMDMAMLPDAPPEAAALADHIKVDFSQLDRDDGANVRTRYDADEALAMKESIREHGILQNLIVTEGEKPGRYKVEAGYRRHRGLEGLLYELVEANTAESAAMLAKRRWVPVKVLTAEEARNVREINLIENLRREAIDPVDEARGYKRLMEEKGYGYEQMAEALAVPGKGPDYIRRRLNLLNAPDVLLDAVRETGMSPRIAELIGKIPNKKDREEMAKRAIKHPQLGIQMGIVQVKEMIRQDFTVSLTAAEWSQDDATVLDDHERKTLGFFGKAGCENDGSCVRCLHRTGNDPLLTDELRKPGDGGGSSKGVDPNICQMPPCFSIKLTATWRTIERLAREQGNRLMDKDQAKKLWVDGAFQGPLAAQYIRRDYRPDSSCTGHYSEETVPTWEELLSGEKVSWILVMNPNKKGTVYILERDTAIAMVEAKCRKAGSLNPFANRPGAKGASAAAVAPKEADQGTFDDLETDEAPVAASPVVVARPKVDQAADAAARARQKHRQEVWRQLFMDGVADKLRQKPAAAMTAAVWEPLVCFCLDLVMDLDDSYIRALLGLDQHTWEDMRRDDRAAAVVKAYAADRTERSQMRWAILILLSGEMANMAPAMGVSEVGKLIADALGLDLDRMHEQATLSAPEPMEEPVKAAEPAEVDFCPAGAALLARGPIEVAGALEKEELHGYHCDECGAVCGVLNDEVQTVEAMAAGTFVCADCRVSETVAFPVMYGFQDLYETWSPEKAAVKAAVAALSIPEKAFLDGLLEGEVKESKPNEHGFFQKRLIKRLSFDKHHWIEVALAVDDAGGWYSGGCYSTRTGGGGSPLKAPSHGSLEDAIAAALHEHLRRFEGSMPGTAADEKLKAKARASVDRLLEALMAILEDG